MSTPRPCQAEPVIRDEIEVWGRPWMVTYVGSLPVMYPSMAPICVHSSNPADLQQLGVIMSKRSSDWPVGSDSLWRHLPFAVHGLADYSQWCWMPYPTQVSKLVAMCSIETNASTTMQGMVQ